MRLNRLWRRADDVLHFDEEGFTLVELIISIVILTLVMGAIAFALFAEFNVAGPTSKSISDSSDAQAVSANLTNDIQSAAQITTKSTSSEQCGSGTQLLGLEWDRVKLTPTYLNTATNFNTVVSYLAVAKGSKSWALERNTCLAGFSSSPGSSVVVSSDICQPSGASPIPVGCKSTLPQLHPTIYTNTTPISATTGWISSAGVTKVKFKITEPGSRYTYTLLAEPITGRRSSTGASGAISSPALSCGFATPGTGPYSTTLCFVNFHAYTYMEAAYTKPGCGQTITEGITGTPYELSYCLKVRAGKESSFPDAEAPPGSSTWSSVCNTPNNGIGPGVAGGVPPLPTTETRPSKPELCSADSSADIVAVSIPTYTAPPTSEAYLGNNGFYTGIPGEAALYTYLESSDATLYFTNISVKDQNGNPASGWELVTGDAESTDSTESITWSTCPAKTTSAHTGTQQTSCTGSPKLSVVADDPTVSPPNYFGNACVNTHFQQLWLTKGSLIAGTGSPIVPSTPSGIQATTSQEVECAGGQSTDKTGTVMLEAPKPTALTVNLDGTGLQAIFLGFML